MFHDTFDQRGFSGTVPANERHKFTFAKRERSHKARPYSHSLILAEVFKTLISSRFIVIVLLILFGIGDWFALKGGREDEDL